MRTRQRSLCPINVALETFGDRWTLLIVRDLMFAGKRHFREFLQSQEGISSNILADRLGALVEQGIVTKVDDPSHQQKALYSLTEMGIALLPVLVQMAAWSRKFVPAVRGEKSPAAMLERGGAAALTRLASSLRKEHL